MFHLYEKVNNNQVYFIAEMSANHGGSLDTALQIVREAAKAGADCIKLQTYTADSLTINCDKEPFMIKDGLWNGYKLYDLYSDAATPYEWHKDIKDECEKCGIDFLSTPFDKLATDFLDVLGAEAFKIASFELVDTPLIEYTASKQKPMIMSCGMASIEEIQDAVDACRKVGNEQIVLLKCCSEYPAPWADMKLLNIQDMRERFHVPVGLSDHSAGSLGAVVGTTLGACVIEKHVKIEGVDSADAAFSMTMSEYRRMVEDVKAAKLMCSGPDYSLTLGEKSSTVFRRSLFAVEKIKVGDTFTEANVRSIRPGNGIKPKYLPEIIGKQAIRDISFGSPLTDEDVGIGALKDMFEKDMFYIYEESKRRIGYNATRFLQMLRTHGGVETARQVIGKKDEPEGLKRLREHGCLEISVEAYVLKPEYKTLFTESEREICKKRIEEA